MSICVTSDSNGNLQATTDSIAECLGWVLLEANEYASIVQPIDYELMGITPEAILFVYTFGMGAVLAMWGIGYAIGSAVTAIRKG